MENITVYTPADCSRILNDLRPKIGHYGWMCKILQIRARHHHYYFPNKFYRILNHFVRKEKPLYIYQTCGSRIPFVGNWWDGDSKRWLCDPFHNSSIIKLIYSRCCESNRTFVDVGANVGLVSANVAILLDGGSYGFAFEPVPETMKRAAATFALNRLNSINLYPVAVGDSGCEITLHVSSNSSGHATAFFDHAVEKSLIGDHLSSITEINTPVIMLDDLMTAGVLSEPAFIKIDVEGYELKALAGAQHLIAWSHPAILFEYNLPLANSAGWTLNDAANLLDGLASYRYRVLRADGSLTYFSPQTDDIHVTEGNMVDILCEPV